MSVMAEEQGIPERYLGKIAQELRRHGLVQSVRGAGGGYRLSRDPAEVTLLDVWQALEGPIDPVECIQNPDGCPRTTDCVTRDVWARLGERMAGVLRDVTLQDLVEQRALKTE
jgi:Rrf2 family protein